MNQTFSFYFVYGFKGIYCFIFVLNPPQNLEVEKRIILEAPGLKITSNESMVSLVLTQYMRGKNDQRFFFKCRSAMALRSVLLIRIGKQNVEIIDK